MDFRDLIVKLYDEKQSTEVEDTTVEVKESNLPSLKKIFEELSSKPVTEAQLKIEPAKQTTSVLKKDNEVLGTINNPTLAKTIGQAISTGQMTLAGTAMKEEVVSEKAPPGMEDVVLSLKKKFPGEEGRAYAIAWSMYNKKHGKDKTNEGDIASTKSQDTMGAGLGAGRSDSAFESIQVSESMNKKHRAAYQEGQADGLRERACRVKHYEDMEEAKHYYEGWKAGLDECYGMGVKNEPITGMEEAIAAMEAGIDEMDKTAYMKQQAIKTPGPTFKAFGQTMHDKDVLETNALAFESLDKQLSALLNEDVEETVNEGLSVSMSTGNQGSPDSVSVTGTDDEAGKLLAFIKQVGLGGMGGDKPMVGGEEPVVAVATSDYGAPKFAGHDNPDMKALLQKVGVGSEDYKDEEGHDHMHGEPCNECGMMEADCGCDKKESVMGEEQTEDQKLYATTESDNSEDDGFDASARNTELDNVGKPASGGATNEDGAEAPGSNSVGQEEQEDAEEVNEESTEKMDQHAEKAAEKVKKDIEYDDKKDREHDKLDEWANNAGQKGTDTAFEQDIEFMTKVISGGLNKPKVTGQTTVPVIAGQDARDGQKEDLGSWIKLAGIKPAVKK